MIIPNVGLNEWGHTFWSWKNCSLLRFTGASCSSAGWPFGVCGVVLQILMGVHRLIARKAPTC